MLPGSIQTRNKTREPVVSQSDLTRKNVGQAEIAVLVELSFDFFITDHSSSCEGEEPFYSGFLFCDICFGYHTCVVTSGSASVCGGFSVVSFVGFCFCF